MKRISIIAVITAFAFIAEAKLYKPNVIYGDDNRLDVYEVERSDIRELADSTAAMIANLQLSQRGASVEISSKTFGSEFGLCSDERFADQPSAANCSAFLVGEDLIATAGHCMTDETCGEYSFVFNYRMESSSVAPTQISSEDVYRCKKVEAREETLKGQDYGLIRLDRPVRGHRILKLATQAVQANDELFVIGNPSGLPTKVADGAAVRRQEGTHFVANLDTYGGNSGSAVFNAKTLEVVGVLVRGENDFVNDEVRQCTVSNKCEADGCHGEEVTNISYVAKALRALK